MQHSMRPSSPTTVYRWAYLRGTIPDIPTPALPSDLRRSLRVAGSLTVSRALGDFCVRTISSASQSSRRTARILVQRQTCMLHLLHLQTNSFGIACDGGYEMRLRLFCQHALLVSSQGSLTRHLPHKLDRSSLMHLETATDVSANR